MEQLFSWRREPGQHWVMATWKVAVPVLILVILEWYSLGHPVGAAHRCKPMRL